MALYVKSFTNGTFTLAKFVSETVSAMTHNSTCLGHLGQHDRDRNISICIAPTKVSKANAIVTVMYHCCRCYHANFCLCKYGLKAGLHYGDNRSKLVH